MVLAFIAVVISEMAVGLAVTIAAIILFGYAYSTHCPMCGHLFFVRLVSDRSLAAHFARETTIFEAEPRCVNCGFVPEADA